MYSSRKYTHHERHGSCSNPWLCHPIWVLKSLGNGAFILSLRIFSYKTHFGVPSMFLVSNINNINIHLLILKVILIITNIGPYHFECRWVCVCARTHVLGRRQFYMHTIYNLGDRRFITLNILNVKVIKWTMKMWNLNYLEGVVLLLNHYTGLISMSASMLIACFCRARNGTEIHGKARQWYWAFFSLVV